MKGSIRGLARQSAFYSLGNVAVKLGGLVLAPVLLNPEYLEVASYGYLALLLVTAQLGVYVIGLGISSGLLRFWTHPDYRNRRESLATTALLLSTIVSVAVTGFVYLFLSDDIAGVLLDNPSL
ncbi:MAG: polysaccharide biosynthesis protein, partial [Rhodothermales bacterium]|nr:polysaccharide biosynthesis protein [Rhodothermales bacterium]